MITSQPLTTSGPASGRLVSHEFAYPRVSQIAPRAHTVLASSLRFAGAPRTSVPAGAALGSR